MISSAQSSLLALTAPVIVVVAVPVKVTSLGPIRFRQERLGENGRAFVLNKFRTMYDGVDHSPYYEYFKLTNIAIQSLRSDLWILLVTVPALAWGCLKH